MRYAEVEKQVAELRELADFLEKAALPVPDYYSTTR